MWLRVLPSVMNIDVCARHCDLDISNLMSFEHLTRRLIILEIAVARNPSLPDFSGLDVVSEAPITSSGSAAVSAMSSWITDKLKERANIQKQSRLFKEEFSKRGKATQDDGDQVGGGGGGNPRWKKKKNKKQGGDGDSGGASSSALGK